MDRVASRALGDFDDPCCVEIALARRRGADRVRRVGSAHVQRVAIDIAVHGDRADAEVVAGANDAKRDLAAIGDEDGGERRSPLYSGMLPCLRRGFVSRLLARERSAATSRRRVSRGSMTSSRYPRAAATYGFAKRSTYSVTSCARRRSGSLAFAISSR